jgi:hypothetical protein
MTPIVGHFKKYLRKSAKCVFVCFQPPKYNSELYFFKNLLVQALGTLLTLIVQHCKTRGETKVVQAVCGGAKCIQRLYVHV